MDYHTHTNFSPDSAAPLEAMCYAALARGVRELAVTNHFDPLAADPDCLLTYDGQGDYAAYLAARERFAGELTLRFGLEAGQSQAYTESVKAVLERFPFDFVLGSVHNIAHDVDLALIDYGAPEIMENLQYYYEEKLKAARLGLYDCLGHLDYPRRYAVLKGADIDFTRFDELSEAILAEVIRQGKGIEVNTKSLLSHGLSLPGMDMLRRYRELGGEIVTVGSDAHSPDAVGSGIREMYGLLSSLGFRYVAYYERREARFLPL